ncbi:hypothetical protein AB0H58_29255 [Nocardia neocaledoniensis]|uniref:hypothetical protein n=1 Tax=Nocardia neocaledoniensis TaxID=236511 RepID=UPI0033D0AC0E
MKKFRTLGFGIVVAAGLAMFGTGVATAEDTTPPATGGGTETEAGTGSADGLAALLEALTTGSAGAEEPETDPVADEEPVETGSAEGLAAALQGLLAGSSAAEEPETEATE